MKGLRHWLPAVLAPVVVLGGALAIPAVANGAPGLPDKSPEQVLALAAQSSATQFSGTVRQTSDLGLPQLPSVGPGRASGSPASTVLELLSASHEARVFAGGPDRERIQLLDPLAERDVIHNGSDVWLYDSKKKQAVHLTAPVGMAHDPSTSTPPELAARVLQAIDPSTALSVGTDARVAGRPVYQLILTPRSGTTLVGSVTLAVDAETGLPLRVLVKARGQESAAFSVGFESIDLSAPDASVFGFTPPAGATVTTPTPSTLPDGAGEAPTPAVSGTGWDTVVALPMSATGIPADGAAGTSSLLDQLTEPVAGGRALQTSLVSILLTNDGRVLAGAVPVWALQAAAR